MPPCDESLYNNYLLSPVTPHLTMPLSYLPTAGWIQIFALVTLLILLAPQIGHYMARVLEGERCFLTPIFGQLEKVIYRICLIDPNEEMDARTYIKAIFAFTLICFLGLFALLMIQIFPNLSVPLAFESSISFITGTNWQSTTPEITFINANQQFGFVVQNFLSCAVGIGVMAALARGIRSKGTDNTLGNFWADITRGTLYILLPLSIILAIFLVSQGVLQNFDQTISFQQLETGETHFIASGPVASQAAIKQLGTNGGGFFMANAAHPLANPTPLSNFIQILVLLLLPAASVFAFGKMIKAKRQSWMLFSTMLIIFIPAMLTILAIEHIGNPLIESLGAHAGLGNMEGKELRFSTTGVALFASAAGATSGGSLNASLDSFMPLASLVPLVLMQLGENIFGGVATGLCNMVTYLFFAIFIASLMIGRKPQFLGKLLGVEEMKMVSVIIIIPALLTLLGTAIAVLTEAGQSGATHSGPHGFTQILYAFTSASNNNGSSLGGIDGSSDFYHISLGIVMILGRLSAFWATLHLAGSLAQQNGQVQTHGMLRADTVFFIFFLIMILILSMSTYIPSLALGPIAEHLTMRSGA